VIYLLFQPLFFIGITYNTTKDLNADHPHRKPIVITLLGKDLKKVYTNYHWYRSLEDKIKNRLPLGDIALIKLPIEKEIDMIKADVGAVRIFTPERYNVENVYNFLIHGAFSTAVDFGLFSELNF